jgi:hypothetical protein
MRQDESLRGLKPTGEVDRTDDCLEAISKQGRLLPAAGVLLAASEQQRIAKTERASRYGQGRAGHDSGLYPSEIPLAHLGERREKIGGDDEAKDRVTEELQSLVRLLTGRLRAI